MFFDVLKAAIVEDMVFLGISILAVIIVGIAIFCWFRNRKFNYYSEFKKVFYSIAGGWFITGAIALGVALVMQAGTVSLNTIKGDKKEIRSAIKKDYEAAMKKANTQAKKEAVKNSYKDNGYNITATGELIIKETSKVKKELIDWLNIRNRMEKNGNYKVKDGIAKDSNRPTLNEKLNAKAISALQFIRVFRFYTWFGALVFVCIIVAVIGLIVGSKGTEDKIKDDLQIQ